MFTRLCRRSTQVLRSRVSASFLLNTRVTSSQLRQTPFIEQTPSFLFQRPISTSLADANADTAMFCYQCEQTEGGKGCTVVGVCGKDPTVAALQDLLIHLLKGVSQYAHEARQIAGLYDSEIDRFIPYAMFSTLTNVNFDPTRFVSYVSHAKRLREKAKKLYEDACAQKGITAKPLLGPCTFDIPESDNVTELAECGHNVGLINRFSNTDPNVFGVRELIIYGLKGMCAYADHALVLGVENKEVWAFVQRALAEVDTTTDLSALLGLALKVGEYNLKVTGMLEEGGTTRYGHPTPTKVLTSTKTGKCILVSGHDLRDLENILEQTKDSGINVYTHGELLPAHGYPGLKQKYPHLVGNYGGAWQLQKMEFSAFPGPIVMTTNCLIEPRKSYKGRIFTRSVVGWPGVQHIEKDDYSAVIKLAKEMKGFTRDETEKYVLTGFGKNAVLNNAGKIVEAVKNGTISRFFVIGGCDGSESARSYYRDVAINTPENSLILTLGCGKYRFINEDLGEVAGFPRVLDVGQCNDSFGAIQIAAALANAFKTDINSLPLSFVVSWFEQKAVAVLLTLLHLNVKNIRLGPNLPAFLTPDVLNLLVEKFGIRPIGDDGASDVQQMLA